MKKTYQNKMFESMSENSGKWKLPCDVNPYSVEKNPHRIKN
jgi:hypothetical protein